MKTPYLPRTALSALLCSLVLSSGCAESEDLDDPGGDSDRADDTQGDDTAIPQLSTSYALDIESRATTRNRQTGEQSEVVTEATLVATVQQDGEVVTMQIETCSLTPPELDGNRPTIKQSLVDSLPLYHAKGSIVAGASGHELTIDDLNILIGIDANQNPVDQDQDGEDGVTIQVDSPIGVIDIYGSAVLTAAFQGPLDNVDRIQGDTSIGMELAIYGDSSFFVDVAGRAEEAKRNSEVIAEENHLVMTALETGSSCANQVQPPLPPPVDGCVSGTGEIGDCCDAGGGPESGQCIDIFENSCPGDLVSFQCPSGASNVKCCAR